MRKEFAQWIEGRAQTDEKLIFLTGDLGFQALERIEELLKDRFVNVGVCEQNMILIAAALAQQGLHPVCYSIAPFAVFRPYEQIRLDVGIHAKNVKIVGNGGGYGYGIMGATHHALEDVAVLSVLPNFRCFIPISNEDVSGACSACFEFDGPAYLRLGFGHWPESVAKLPSYQPIRKLWAGKGAVPWLSIATMGPVALNLISWIQNWEGVETFGVSEVPCEVMESDLARSVAASGRLWVIEEHASRGGLGEYLVTCLAKGGIGCAFAHTHAAGYPDGFYGSQSYHQERSGLDTESLQEKLTELRDSLA